MRALVWFRSDLRVDDNPALFDACANAERGVVAVFAICSRQWREHEWADIKVEFLLRNLACLREGLAKLNVPLLIVEMPTFAEVPAALLEVARRHACDALFFNREYEVHERRRDEAVARGFADDGRAVCEFDGSTILPPDALRTGSGRFYTVFTPFKRAWIGRAEAEGLEPPLRKPRRQAEMVCSPDLVPETVAGFDLGRGQPERWPAGEGVAVRQLSRFIERRLGDYKKLRDWPGVDGTSRLSPFLAAGVLSPRRCLSEALAVNQGRLDGGRAGVSTWISELIWREFYRHVLVGYPGVSMGRAFKPETERLVWCDDSALFEAWCAGRTGYPIVDAGMRELAETGWMHNRVRMIVAMFLTKDLFIDWRWGERHFMRHLIDGDLASNNGGWQWAASTGTDAVPYFRIFNPGSQSKKFDPSGDYIRRYIPELRDVDTRALHDSTALTAQMRKRVGYATPICDHAAARNRTIAAFRALRGGER